MLIQTSQSTSTMSEDLNTSLLSIARELSAIQEKFKFFSVQFEKFTVETKGSINGIEASLSDIKQRNKILDWVFSWFKPAVFGGITAVCYWIIKNVWNNKLN